MEGGVVEGHVVVRNRSIRLVEFKAIIRIDTEQFYPKQRVNPHHRRWSKEMCDWLVEEGVAKLHYW